MDEEATLKEILEAVYWDTLAPLAEQLRVAGVDLEPKVDGDVASYWEVQPPYAPLTTQR